MFKYRNTGRSPGAHPYTQQDMKHVGWCIRHGISISVDPYWEGKMDDWRIELRINGKIHLDPKIYEVKEAYIKMYEYYKYYYDKYNKQ